VEHNHPNQLGFWQKEKSLEEDPDFDPFENDLTLVYISRSVEAFQDETKRWI
jgi:hypothetical protein